MSTPASEVGNIGTAEPTATATPATATANPSGWTSGLSAIPSFGSMLGRLNPFSGSTSFLPNAALVAVGIALALGALLIANKETVIQAAGTAVEA